MEVAHGTSTLLIAPPSVSRAGEAAWMWVRVSSDIDVLGGVVCALDFADSRKGSVYNDAE